MWVKNTLRGVVKWSGLGFPWVSALLTSYHDRQDRTLPQSYTKTKHQVIQVGRYTEG